MSQNPVQESKGPLGSEWASEKMVQVSKLEDGAKSEWGKCASQRKVVSKRMRLGSRCKGGSKLDLNIKVQVSEWKDGAGEGKNVKSQSHFPHLLAHLYLTLTCWLTPNKPHGETFTTWYS